MEISAENAKRMTKSGSGIHREIKENVQRLDTETSFKYLKQLSQTMAKIKCSFTDCEQATSALTKLKPFWRYGSKVTLMRSFGISMFLYALES